MSDMKKIIIIILLLIVPAASALLECKGTMNPKDIPCMTLLPNNVTITSCSLINASYYNGSIKIYQEVMQDYSSFYCNATFNITNHGTYGILYSTGDTGSIIVQEDVNNRYYLYVVVTIVFILLIIVGYRLEDTTFIVLAGMLCCVMAVNIFLNGFPDLTNEFLKNGIVIVLAGIGFYLIVGPSVEDIKGLFTSG